MGQRKTGCLAIILFTAITKSDGKINKFTSAGVLQVCHIQEQGKVSHHHEFFSKKTQPNKKTQEKAKKISSNIFRKEGLNLLKKLLLIQS